MARIVFEEELLADQPKGARGAQQRFRRAGGRPSRSDAEHVSRGMRGVHSQDLHAAEELNQIPVQRCSISSMGAESGERRVL